MTKPSESQDPQPSGPPEDAAAGQPAGGPDAVTGADNTPPGGMRLGEGQGVGPDVADGANGAQGADGGDGTGAGGWATAAGGSTGGDGAGGDKPGELTGNGQPAAAPLPQAANPAEWRPPEWRPEQWQPADWAGSPVAAGVATAGSGQLEPPGPAGPGQLEMAGAHGQPAPPPYAGVGGGDGGGNGFVPGAETSPTGDEPPLEVLPLYEKRKPRTFWFRSRLLLLIAAIWGLLFWYSLSSDPLLSIHDGLVQTWNSKWWLAVLFAAELVRQIHYIISERWGAYNHFWMDRVFAANRPKGRMTDWARYRAKRIFSIIIFIALVAVICGAAFNTSPVQGLFDLPGKLVSLAGYIVYVVFILLLVVGQFAAIFWFLSKGGVDTYFPDDIKTRFSNVWGQDAVVGHVKESMVFLEDPESIEARGGYVPGGILLWGPPGTGKTLIAEAVAGETGKPFVFVDPGAFINMFMGVGVLKVKSLFRKLRKLAMRYGGVIVFFDEADSLGNRGMLTGPGIFGPGGVRGMEEQGPWATGMCHGGSYLSESSVSTLLSSYQTVMQAQKSSIPDGRRGARDRMMMGGMMGGGGMGTLQALLSEMSGLTKPRGFMNRYVRRILGMKPKPPPKYRMLIMMATNMPNSLDEAMLRPGRIDRIFKVGYPSKAGRIRTYQGYFAKVKNEITPEDIDKLATITPYATGATIKDLVNESLIVALRNKHDAITWSDVLDAKRLKELGPPEDVEYVERERHSVAIHEACHAVVAYKVRKHLEIDLATIEKGGTYLGMVSSIKPEDRFTSWRSEYEADVMVSLASLAGERMFFGGDSSSGVSGDLESATTIAQLMEGYWGMGSTISSRAARRTSGGWPPSPGEGGEMMGGEMGKKIEERLSELLGRTGELLGRSRIDVFAVAHALEAHKTLTGEDVEAVIEGRYGRLIDGRVYKVPQFVEVFEAYHDRIADAHLNRERVAIALPNPVEWAPELVAEAANGNGHVGEDELEGVGADASGATEWGLPEP
jgi:cell division protease FtsH